MLADKFGFAAKGADHGLGADADVLVVLDEQAKLRGKVDKRFIVGGGGQQNAAAVIGSDIILDGLVAFALAVPEVVALVDQDRAIPLQLLQLGFDARKRDDFGVEFVGLNIVVPHVEQVLGAYDQAAPIDFLNDFEKRGCHDRLSETDDIADHHAATLVEVVRGHLHCARLEVEQLVPENAGDAKLRLTVPRLLREVIGDLQIDVVGFDQCLTRPAFLDDRRQLFRNVDAPAIIPAILKPACQLVASVVIHDIDIQFALEREAGKRQVAAADKPHLRIDWVGSVQQIELGVKLMLEEQLHGHFPPTNLPCQTP